MIRGELLRKVPPGPPSNLLKKVLGGNHIMILYLVVFSLRLTTFGHLRTECCLFIVFVQPSRASF